MAEQSVVVRVWGRVQGVGFRYFTRQQALLWGLRGHACNLDDGSVEIVICGPQPGVQLMLGWLAHGPSGADVIRMDYQPAPPPAGDGFYTN